VRELRARQEDAVIVLHKPFDPLTQARRKAASVADLTPPSSFTPAQVRVLETPRGFSIVTGWHAYSIRGPRGTSEWVRLMPEEQEAEYRDAKAQIAALQKRAAEIVEEGWVRAKPYRPEGGGR
jgi:hypothetical protein